MTVFTHTSYTSAMNWRIASSVACDVGLAAMEVEARAEEVVGKVEDEDDEAEAEVEAEVEVGGGRGRWRRRKRTLPAVRNSDM